MYYTYTCLSIKGKGVIQNVLCEKLVFGPSVILPCPHKMGAITLRGRDLSGACLSCSTKQFEGNYSTSQNGDFLKKNLTLYFQFFTGDGICSPKCSCTPESNHSSPAATQNTTGGDDAGEISASFLQTHVFDNHHLSNLSLVALLIYSTAAVPTLPFIHPRLFSLTPTFL